MSDSRTTAVDGFSSPRIEGTQTTNVTVTEQDRDGADEPRTIARRLCEGYALHDERDREGAIDAMAAVDRAQFDHLTAAEARAAAEGLVDSLWAKDEIEEPYVTNGRVEDVDGLAEADWERVEEPLRRRARIVGMDEAYARLTTEGWRRHKVGGDYSTPIMEAQRIQVGAALGTGAYPEKRRAGRSGYGELPARYLVAVELHDTRTRQARERIVAVMTPYFETLLADRSERR